MGDNFLTMPWEIQVALGSGYAAYMLAYSGIRDHHKSVDIAFRSVAFGLVATVVMYALQGVPRAIPAWLIIVASFVASALSGICWRRYGMRTMQSLLRKYNVTWADDTPSAWSGITLHNNAHEVYQVSVQTDDGFWLNCTDTSIFGKDPYGPCVFGPNGDIGLYVTDEIEPDGTVYECRSVRDPDYGVRMTYIPANRIRRVAIRFAPSSGLETAGGEDSAPEEEP